MLETQQLLSSNTVILGGPLICRATVRLREKTRLSLALTVITQTHSPFPIQSFHFENKLEELTVPCLGDMFMFSIDDKSLAVRPQAVLSPKRKGVGFPLSCSFFTGFSHPFFQQIGTSKCTMYRQKNVFFCYGINS